MSHREHLYDVIILGAGMAGLTAAHQLLKSRPHLDLLVVEAKDRTGGRVLSKPVACADGHSRPWCFGGAWVSRGQRHLLELLDELGLATFQQFKEGTKVLEMDCSITRYNGSAPTIGLLNLLDLDLTLRALERQAAGLKACTPEAVARLDEDPVQAAVQRLTQRRESELFLRGVVAPVLQGSDAAMSQVHALNVAQSAGGFEKLFRDAQELRIDGGAQRLTDRLAESVGPARLRLGWAVSEVRQTDDCQVELTSASGQRLASRLLLCTLPLAGLSSVRFSPELPPLKRRLADSCRSAGTGAVKAVVTYPSAFWRSAGCSGEILSCGGIGSGAGPISVGYDATSCDGSQAAILLILTAASRASSPEERKTAALEHLARFYPRDQVLNYADFVEHDWSAEPYHATCMASPVPIGSGGLLLNSELARPFCRVHFAGSDFATEWIGYMEGAVQSAKRAVADMLPSV